MRRWAGQALAAVGIWALCLATGCNGFFVYPGSNSGGGTGNYVYVANATTQSLDAFSIGAGTLTKVASYSLGFIPKAVVVNANNTLVIVAGLGYIDTFSIQSGGALSLLNGSNGANIVTSGIAAMDVSPDGQWLVGVDQIILSPGVVTLDEYQISSSGQLTPVATAPYVFSGAGTVVPSAVKFAPNGQALYVACGTAGDVMYTFNTAYNSGLLTPTRVLRYSAGANSGTDNDLAISLDSNYVFLAHSNGSTGSLLVYSSGLLAQVGSMTAGTQPFSVALNKAGTNVYLANQLSGSISGYSVPAGVPSALTNSPYILVSPTAGLRGLVADNSGNYMVAITNATLPYLTLLSIDSTGALFTATTGAEPAGAVSIAATH